MRGAQNTRNLGSLRRLNFGVNHMQEVRTNGSFPLLLLSLLLNSKLLLLALLLRG